MNNTGVNYHETFRRGSAEEKDRLRQLGILAYSQFKDALSSEGWQMMDKFLQSDRMWTQLVSNSTIFVCEAGDELAGMAYLVPGGNPTHIYPADWSYVRMVGVHPEYRGKGIAKCLTQMCVDHARQTNEKIVGLHTSEKMDDARHIYEAIGFRKYKEIDPIYGMRYWLYCLDL